MLAPVPWVCRGTGANVNGLDNKSATLEVRLDLYICLGSNYTKRTAAFDLGSSFFGSFFEWLMSYELVKVIFR